MSNYSSWILNEGKQFVQGTLKSTPLGLGKGGPPDELGENPELVESLQERLGKNERYFQIVFALSVLLSICTVVSAFLPATQDKPSIPAGLGVTASVAIGSSVALYKQKDLFDKMLSLALYLGRDEMKKVLDVLIREVERGGK